MPKISFVMPAYNAEKYISESIESVINQTFSDWELVIVDDASTDSTVEIVDRYAKNDKRVRLIRNSINSGSAVLPRLKAVRESHGSFISSLDADDYIEPCFAEIVLKKQKDTDCDIVFAYMHKFNETGIIERIPTSSFNYDQIITGREACARTLKVWEFPFNGCCCRRYLYTESILNEKNNEQNRDDIIARQLFLNAKNVTFTKAKYFYRQHEDSIVHKFSIGRFGNIELSKELSELILGVFPEDKDVISTVFMSVFYTIQNNIVYLNENKDRLNKQDCDNIRNRLNAVYDYLSKNRSLITNTRIRTFLLLNFNIAFHMILLKNKLL